MMMLMKYFAGEAGYWCVYFFFLVFACCCENGIPDASWMKAHASVALQMFWTKKINNFSTQYVLIVLSTVFYFDRFLPPSISFSLYDSLSDFLHIRNKNSQSNRTGFFSANCFTSIHVIAIGERFTLHSRSIKWIFYFATFVFLRISVVVFRFASKMFWINLLFLITIQMLSSPSFCFYF